MKKSREIFYNLAGIILLLVLILIVPVIIQTGVKINSSISPTIVSTLQSTLTPTVPFSPFLSSPPPTQVYKDLRYSRIAGNGVLIYGGQSEPALYITTDLWSEATQDGWFQVFTGTAGSDVSASGDLLLGAVAVYHLDKNMDPFPLLPGTGVYMTPKKVGPVDIVDVQGEVLTLVAQDGSIFHFDVATDQYINQPLVTGQASIQRTVSSGQIVESSLSPFSGLNYTYKNQWFNDSSGQRVTALVGEKKDFSHNGVIVVAKSTGAPTALTHPDVYPIPDGGFGPYRIVDDKNGQIVVVNKGGSPFFFDLASRRFLSDSEISAIPTDAAVATYEAPMLNRTPQPTVTMMPTPIRIFTTAVPAYP